MSEDFQTGLYAFECMGKLQRELQKLQQAKKDGEVKKQCKSKNKKKQSVVNKLKNWTLKRKKTTPNEFKTAPLAKVAELCAMYPNTYDGSSDSHDYSNLVREVVKGGGVIAKKQAEKLVDLRNQLIHGEHVLTSMPHESCTAFVELSIEFADTIKSKTTAASAEDSPLPALLSKVVNKYLDWMENKLSKRKMKTPLTSTRQNATVSSGSTNHASPYLVDNEVTRRQNAVQFWRLTPISLNEKASCKFTYSRRSKAIIWIED